MHNSSKITKVESQSLLKFIMFLLVSGKLDTPQETIAKLLDLSLKTKTAN